MKSLPPASPVDLLVVGGGPIGIACALAARNAGLSARIVEKGAIVNSMVGYPSQMEFFSTPELLEIGGHPLATRRYKPLREEAIDYYRGVAQRENLDIRLGERVLAVTGNAGAFSVETTRGVHEARAVVLAIGFFDQPNKLDVPGGDKTHHLIAFAALTFPSAALYRRALIWVLPAALIYGIAIELIQPYVGRHGERVDFYADAIGALIGVALGVLLNVILIQPLAKKHQRPRA